MPRTFWAIFTLRFWYDLADGLVQRFGRTIEADDAATLKRFFVSQHVADLRKIVSLSLAGVLLVIACFLLPLEGNVQEVVYKFGWASLLNPLQLLHILFRTAAAFLAFFGPVVAAFGVIVAWAYQTASARLGVVDLFACEISTLCRVATVLDTVLRLAEKFDSRPAGEGSAASSGPPTAPPQQQATSEEDYFPVFNNNVRDLQSLEARVVVNITAFYTYMKAVRDFLRALHELPPPSAPGPAASQWYDTARNLIYMMYLGFESGRKAIKDLVEFEPEQAERTVVILISELAAYGFLRGHFKDDMHQGRLVLREAEYRTLVDAQGKEILKGRAAASDPGRRETWEQAYRLLPELQRRRDAAIPPQQ
ncbi:MAG TPA: hypothetical protein VLX44_14210 [Xanthobacteraceae bacterium]|nr:hypothetical protein [Xanthobacteraceae bacterium]